MDPLLALVGLSFAGTTVLAVLYTHQWLTAPNRVARRRIAPASGGDMRVLGPLLRTRSSRLPFVDQLPLSNEARARVESELERAGVPLRVSEYLFLRLFAGLVTTVAAVTVANALSAGSAVVIASGTVAFLVGWQLPRLWVSRKRAARVERIETQLPNALTAIAKSLRAGTGLLQALDFSSSQIEAPLRDEFAWTLRQIRLGVDPEEAFSALSRRVGSPDLDIAVTGILIQRNVGGNLSEILTSVSQTITERDKLHREIKVLTSRQMLTGNLVAAMPVLVGLAFLSTNRELADLLFSSTVGRITLAFGIAFEIAGLFMIRHFARIEV